MDRFLLPLTIVLGAVSIGYAVRKVVFSRLMALSRKTSTPIDDIIISSLRVPIIIWSFMTGVYFALKASSLPDELVGYLDKTLLVLGILSVTLVLSKTVARAIEAYSERVRSVLPVVSLTRNFSSIVIFGIGVLIILNSLGISITPILATLGVGGLAVALGMQETLSNLFSGIHIAVSRQIRTGDYIKLESGEEGYVTDINWRTTQVRMLANNIVLVPNSKLVQSIVTNYHLPDKELAVLVNLGVHYRSDLAKVRKVTCEVAKEVMREVPGGVPEFEPFLRFNEFGDSAVKFSVIMRGKEFTDQYLIKDQFIERLHARYLKEGITIPYPIRAVNYEQEKAQ